MAYLQLPFNYSALVSYLTMPVPAWRLTVNRSQGWAYLKILNVEISVYSNRVH